MELNTYVDQAARTAIYPEHAAIYYPALGLAGEAGEVANKVKKILRDYNGDLNSVPDELINEISKEIGDCLWYLAALVRDLNDWDLETIATQNLIKLYDRQNRGVLGGSGDNR